MNKNEDNLARELMSEGVDFYPQCSPRNSKEIEDFVNAYISPKEPFSMSRYFTSVLKTKNNEIAAVVALEIQNPIFSDGSEINIEINFIAVHPDLRGLNIGMSMLSGSLSQMVPYARTLGPKLKCINGVCKPSERGFYEKCGFTVSESDEPIPDGVMPKSALPFIIDEDYPCSFWITLDK